MCHTTASGYSLSSVFDNFLIASFASGQSKYKNYERHSGHFSPTWHLTPQPPPPPPPNSQFKRKPSESCQKDVTKLSQTDQKLCPSGNSTIQSTVTVQSSSMIKILSHTHNKNMYVQYLVIFPWLPVHASSLPQGHISVCVKEINNTISDAFTQDHIVSCNKFKIEAGI